MKVKVVADRVVDEEGKHVGTFSKKVGGGRRAELTVSNAIRLVKVSSISRSSTKGKLDSYEQ